MTQDSMFAAMALSADYCLLLAVATSFIVASIPVNPIHSIFGGILAGSTALCLSLVAINGWVYFRILFFSNGINWDRMAMPAFSLLFAALLGVTANAIWRHLRSY